MHSTALMLSFILRRTANRWRHGRKSCPITYKRHGMSSRRQPNTAYRASCLRVPQLGRQIPRTETRSGLLPSGWALNRFLAPQCPVNAYGLSKAFGELAGRMFVDEGQLRSFVAVRIGNYNPTPSDDELVRTRWLGTEDMRSLLRRCVEAEFNGFHVVYGVSAQPSSPYDLSHTSQLLHWQPRQTLP